MRLNKNKAGGVEWIHLDQDMVPMAGFCEDGNEFSCSIKEREILFYSSGYFVFK
jgi:hypothetical protein